MKYLALILSLLAFNCTAGSHQSISLAGKWRHQLDRADIGIVQHWFDRELQGTARLPGSLPAQGIGDSVTTQTKWTGGIVDQSFFTAPEYAKYRQPGDIKVPFWLQPEKYYVGVAWFQRDITIPADWQGNRIVLFLERPHWETVVWVDGRLMGTNRSLATPHEYDLGQLPPGRHTLSIRVNNQMVIDVGENSHCVSDHTQGNWNGVVGQIELRATPLVWIEDVQAYPHVSNKTVTVKVEIGDATGQPGSGTLIIPRNEFVSAPISRPVSWDGHEGSVAFDLPLAPNTKLWDEFSPNLIDLPLVLDTGSARITRHVRFGLREIATDGTQFTVNGQKTFLRGTLECCIFPITGHPPTDVDSWKHVIRVAKSYGLNLLRFHSYCPPEAAFAAADELGMYLQVETCWANQSTTIGDGKPVDSWVYSETERILKTHGNHPSFILMPYGNEPGGERANAYLAQWVSHFKALDSRRFFTSGSGWPQLAENQFHVTPDPRIQAWGGALNSRINAKSPETTTDYGDYIAKRSVPVISHEIGQWCVYPNFDEIPKYTGYLKPKNFEVFRDTLNAHGMGPLAKRFLIASGKLQTLCYKEDIESALRTPGMGGFELLDLHDFPGQGTALVGVLDPFWEDKGYVTAKEYSRFCNSTVPLARLGKRVFTTDESLHADIEIAHFGPHPISNAPISWKLALKDGSQVASGKLAPQDIPIGNAIKLGSISVDLQTIKAPAQGKLIVSVARTENDWDVWFYLPRPATTANSNVLVTSEFDDHTQAHLRAGGKVLLTIPAKQVRNFDTAPVQTGFSSVFWNTAWSGRQPPTTLGILCDPKNPALALFPTDDHSNWQWWYLIHRAGALRLDLLPSDLKPIVRVIDDWFTARPLGLIVEGKVGSGKIVICGFDLTRNSDDPVSRQMQTSLVQYLESTKCRPTTELTCSQIRSLAVEHTAELKGVHSIKTDSEQTGYEAGNAIDGDHQTLWHTPWGSNAPDFPHQVVIELESPRTISGFTALPRQDGNHNGWIKDYAFYGSNDGITWGTPVSSGLFANSADLHQIRFAAPVTAKYLKLVALTGYANGPWASLAEFNLIPEHRSDH